MNSATLSPDLKKSLTRKAWTAGALLLIAAIGTAVVYRYFYFLDAYFYTYEFYWQFNVKNLRAGDTALFVEYFTPMGITTEALPQLVLSHLIQNFYLPFTKPILIGAAHSAFGSGIGAPFSYIALAVTALLAFAVGSFLFGDLLPLLAGTKFPTFRDKMLRSPGTAIALSLLFAIPWIPIALPAMTGALLKVPLQSMSRCLLAGLLVRTVALLAAPTLFV
ncbi:MAG: hypothetical protein ACOY32_08035 [Thermodesulfobacteriota bacterium]